MKLQISVKVEEGLAGKVEEVCKNLIRLGWAEDIIISFIKGKLITEFDNDLKTLSISMSNPYQDFCSKCGMDWFLHDFGVPLPYCP